MLVWWRWNQKWFLVGSSTVVVVVVVVVVVIVDKQARKASTATLKNVDYILLVESKLSVPVMRNDRPATKFNIQIVAS